MATPAFVDFNFDRPDWTAPGGGLTFAQDVRDNQLAMLLMQFLGGGALPAGWTKTPTVDGTGRLTQMDAANGALRFRVVFAFSVVTTWQLASRTVTWSNDSGATWAAAAGSGTYTYTGLLPVFTPN